MDDLISRAAAVRALASSNGDYLDALERFEKIHAVDAVPVVHGRWIKRKTWNNAVCSYCSFENANMTKYCPACGAKMDGERRGDNG